MDQNNAPDEHDGATPIFNAYRRGYDPEQVDRYVTDLNRRLDEALHRASEAERKLAAAVGQLRELHRRVAVLESEERAPQQTTSIDMLGERVQRILQEAWEGAFALRQSVEQEVAGMKDAAANDAQEIIETARRKARAIEEEIERRRRAYLERVEEDRARAVAQMSYLGEQRKAALEELIHVKDLIEATVGEVGGGFGARLTLIESSNADPVESAAPNEPKPEPPGAVKPVIKPLVPELPERELPRTMPVHRLTISDPVPRAADTSTLVRSHRESESVDNPRPMAAQRATERATVRASVFDFDEQQPS